jgi:hypothetical protein
MSLRVLTVSVCIAVFAATAAVRFLSLVGFTNDQYITLAGAQQMLFGEWPTRDFLDPGLPLAYGASAAVQLLLGRTLFAEAILTSVAFGIAAALTVVAARRLSGSLLIGILAAVLEVAIFPRGYAYPKVLLYAAAPLIIWWYLRRPSLARMAGLAVFIQIAFLFRHDHGAYIGCGAAVTVALAGEGTGSMPRLFRRIGWFVALVLLTSLPYLLYIGVNGGVARYLAQGMAFNAAEVAENGFILPLFDPRAGLRPGSEAFLFCLFELLPLAAALVLAFRSRGSDRLTFARVAPLVVIAVVANRGFIRSELSTRLADAIVPAVLLSSWLVGRIPRVQPASRRYVAAGLATIVVVMSGIAVTTVGATVEQLNRASLFGGLRRMPERFAGRSAELHARFAGRQMPAGPVGRLVPFFEYVDRCTTTEQRLLLPGFIPEVAFYAQRPFAGGRSTIIPGFIDSPEDRQILQKRLARETIPFVVVTSRSRESVYKFYPELASFIAGQFEPLVTYRFGEDQSVIVDVLVSRTLTRHGSDPGTGWPCFR